MCEYALFIHSLKCKKYAFSVECESNFFIKRSLECESMLCTARAREYVLLNVYIDLRVGEDAQNQNVQKAYRALGMVNIHKHFKHIFVHSLE